MAGNSTSIDSVVDPAAIDQFVALKASGKELRTELVQLLEVAIKLNATLGGSTPANFTKNLQASTDATNKIIANNNKQIENEQKKAAKQEEIVNKYLVLLSKQENARQQADAKEIQQAELKASKLKAIKDKADAEAARKANVQFPSGGRQPLDVEREPTTPAVRNEPIITGTEDMSANYRKSTEAIQEENAAILEQQEVLAGLSVAQRANIELLLTLQSERAENTAELKNLNAEDAKSGERLVFLTARQLELKVAIQQTNATLAQQTKEMSAADGSAIALNARLAQMRTLYDNLSVSERENAEIGGVLLTEIEALDIATKQLSDSQGIHNKHVGDYAKGFDLLEKVESRVVSQTIRMIAHFALVTVAFGAIEWLYNFIRNLDVFTGRLDQATQNLQALNEVQKSVASDAGASVGKFKILTDTIKDQTISYHDRLRAAEELKKLWPDELAHSTAQSIANGEESDSLDTLTTSVVKLAKAKAAANEIEKVEGEIIALQIEQEKVNNAKSDIIDKDRIKSKRNFIATLNYEADNYGKARLTEAQIAVKYNEFLKQQDNDVEKGAKRRADVANKDINDQIAVKKKTIEYLEKYGGLQAEAESVEGKPKKTRTNDHDNTDLLESNRIDIEAAKKNAKLVEDNQENSYQVRIVALNQYIKKSKELLDNSAQILEKDTNLRHQQRLNELKKLHLAELDLEIEKQNEIERLGKEELEKHKKLLGDLLTSNKENEQENLYILDNASKLALQGLDKAKNDKENALALQRAKGKISEKQYNKELLAINDDYNIQRIQQELIAQKLILAAKEGSRDSALTTAKITGATPAEVDKIQSAGDKDIQPTKDNIADLTNKLGDAQAKKAIHEAGGNAKDNEGEKKQIEQAATDLTVDSINAINDLRQKAFEADIARLEKRGELIDENAQIEKDAVDRSLDSQANKARALAVIEAQTASQHKALAAQEAQLKHKAAVADKEATIARIIASGALAVVNAFATQPAYLGIVLGVITAAAVGVELAKAVATPIPQFAKGGTHKGGLLLYGEEGRELVEEPGRPAYYSPGVATLAYAPAGTKITPNNMLPETPKWTSTRTDNRDVVDAIDRLGRKETPRQRKPQLQGWVDAQRQADAWNNYSSNHFK